MEKLDKECILRMAAGAIEERVNYEATSVIDNITDLNTKPTAKRKITITLEFTPDETRTKISLNATVKSALAPTVPVSTAMCITSDGKGEMIVAEMVPQIPGQISIEGKEQPQPKILKLVNQN